MSFGGLSWYAAPDGGADGDGTPERPWDLATAMGHPGRVAPGDIVWLRGGRYAAAAPLECGLRGEAGAPVTVRGDPADPPAVVEFADGRPYGLHITGEHAWYRDFEVVCTNPRRWSETPGDAGNPRGIGVLCEAGPGTKLIHLRVRDFGTSLFESRPFGLEIYGCSFSDSYWDAPDRSHGPGLYVRNPMGAPRKRIENNFVFQHGRQGLQGFGSVPFAEVDFVGNILFNNGIARDGFHRNFLFGNATDEHRRVAVRENSIYFARGTRLGHEYNTAGGVGGCREIELTGNWIAQPGRPALAIRRAADEIVEGNRFWGEVEMTSLDGGVAVSGSSFEARYPANEYFDDERAPDGPWVRCRLDAYLPDAWDRRALAYVAAFNWAGAAEVETDLSEAVATGSLGIGTAIRIRSAQSLGEATMRIFDGGPLRLPMTGWNARVPAGRGPGEPMPPTFPEFGAFLLDWPVGGAAAERNPRRMADPGAGLTREQAWTTRREVWGGGLSRDRAAERAARARAWRARTSGLMA